MRKNSDSYSIRQVMDLTGLSEFTIRGWENRYQAFQPQRTPTGRRVYAKMDLEKAILLRELVNRQHRIGDIATLSINKLQKLLEISAIEVSRSSNRFERRIQNIMKALALQQWKDMETELHQVIRKEEPRDVLRDFIAPLVQDLGSQVGQGLVSIAQEHIFTSILKEVLYKLSNKSQKTQSSRRFLIAAPEGDFHELGILIAHVMTTNSGDQSLYLGPNSPKKDLCETALRFGASHIVLGSTVSRKEGAKEELFSYIHFLDQHLSKNIELWFGGRNAVAPFPELSRDVFWLSSLRDLDQRLYL